MLVMCMCSGGGLSPPPEASSTATAAPTTAASEAGARGGRGEGARRSAQGLAVPAEALARRLPQVGKREYSARFIVKVAPHGAKLLRMLLRLPRRPRRTAAAAAIVPVAAVKAAELVVPLRLREGGEGAAPHCAARCRAARRRTTLRLEVRCRALVPLGRRLEPRGEGGTTR